MQVCTYKLMEDSEKILEKQLIIEIKQKNGWCLKLWSISFTGLPDRLILLPEARIYFVELKSKGKKPTPRQMWVHERLRQFGFKVYWIDTYIKLKNFINEI